MPFVASITLKHPFGLPEISEWLFGLEECQETFGLVDFELTPSPLASESSTLSKPVRPRRESRIRCSSSASNLVFFAPKLSTTRIL
eukprot:3832279-Pyramimonas_sp.AAC.1